MLMEQDPMSRFAYVRLVGLEFDLKFGFQPGKLYSVVGSQIGLPSRLGILSNRKRNIAHQLFSSCLLQ